MYLLIFKIFDRVQMWLGYISMGKYHESDQVQPPANFQLPVASSQGLVSSAVPSLALSQGLVSSACSASFALQSCMHSSQGLVTSALHIVLAQLLARG